MRFSRHALIAIVVALIATTSAQGQGLDAGADPPANDAVDPVPMSGVFRSMVPVGGPTSDGESRVLADALAEYKRSKYPDEIAPIASFIQNHPDSPWNTALRFNLGLIYKETGHLSKAILTWQEGWKASRDITAPRGKAIADAMFGELAVLLMYAGNSADLAKLLDSAQGRTFTGAASENVAQARAELKVMQQSPQMAFRCGPFALLRICMFENEFKAGLPLLGARATSRGISLTELRHLAMSVGLNYQMAFRRPGSGIPVPSVINFKMGHYAAIIAKTGDLYRIAGSGSSNEMWARTSTIDDEATGYFLIPEGGLAEGWRPVDALEGNNIWGRGPTGPNTAPPGPNDPQVGGGCGGGGAPGAPSGPNGSNGGAGGSPAGGCTTYSVDAMDDSLELHDELLGYQPPLGPAVSFQIFYMHRDVEQPATFDYSNLGPKWTSNWISYITDNVGVNGGEEADLYLPGGGLEVYTYFNGFAPGLMSQAHLTRISNGFVRTLPDGSTQTFTQQAPAIFPWGQRYFLTAIVDPQGHAVTFQYDSSMRIVSVTDAIHQVTEIQYNEPSDPLKITGVVDPFGRAITLRYSPDGTHLSSTTDRLNITSTYGWGVDDFISTLSTPYGVTSFSTSDTSTTCSPAAQADGQTLCFWRSLTITDPEGLTSRVDMREGAPGIERSEPNSVVPQGNVVQLINQYLEDRNTFFWDPYQLSLALATPNPDGSPDYTKARILHFEHQNEVTTGPVLESLKDPLENRIWYNYPLLSTNSTPNWVGSSNKPTVIARVLDDGSTQLQQYQGNDYGHVTLFTDPIGRQMQVTYASNGIDLVSEQWILPNGELAPGATSFVVSLYNAQHQPLKVQDGGQPIAYSYDTNGQTHTVSVGGDVFTYSHDGATGFLNSVSSPPLCNPACGVATRTFTPDTQNRVGSFTNEQGLTIVVTYDAADRIIQRTYPDNTTEKFHYTLLDLDQYTDRMGRQTTISYDHDRRPIAITDNGHNTTKLTYYPSSYLLSVTDPANSTTTFSRDGENRVTAVIFSDDTTVSYSFEKSTSRLHSATNALGQSATYSYNVDNSLAFSEWTYPATPEISDPSSAPISLIWDPHLPRLSSVTQLVDAANPSSLLNQQITYTYSVSGSFASQLSLIAGEAYSPSGSPQVQYQYDARGRMTGLTGYGGTYTRQFDPLNRVVTDQSSLGNFSYSYINAGPVASRRVSIPPAAEAAHPSFSIEMSATFYGPEQDRRALQLLWRRSGGKSPKGSYAPVWPGDTTAFLSLGYSYNADGTIATSTPYQYRLPSQVTYAGFPYGMQYGATGALQAVTPTTNANNASSYSFGYDAASNLTQISVGSSTKTLQSNSVNEIVGLGASYDKAGRLIAIDDPSLPLRFHWNARDELVRIDERDHGSTHITYDALGRWNRIEEYVLDGSAGTEILTEVKNYVWCGSVLCAQLDTNGQVVTRYFSQGFISGGRKYFYTLDLLGSVFQVIGQNGAVNAQYRYDPFGNRVETLGSMASDIGFAGMYQHGRSGLMLAQYRSYAPSLGRWLSRDPIWESSTLSSYFSAKPVTALFDTNPYIYGFNNPVNRKDTLGLQAGAWAFAESGAEIGSLLGPVGTVAGGALGLAFAVYGGNLVWHWLFNSPYREPAPVPPPPPEPPGPVPNPDAPVGPGDPGYVPTYPTPDDPHVAPNPGYLPPPCPIPQPRPPYR
ncbi:RHS repeat-associated core domain-containing protein [Paraburkholderia oxyphila]|uniref:RHS repeat-associated core domain-containing protein n=1 Tax=Paraburkholderia oxyphila TaxID=614212 RepID=UPI000A0627B2|nr:RHS repeat-associated core domain-containing protein [Paraburkholderia oxyphila]